MEIINVSNPNDGLGDKLRDAFVKTNSNFTELDIRLKGAVGSYLGSITPSSSPTGSSGSAYWSATQPGVYTNFGGLTVASNSLAIISRVSGSFAISQTPIDSTSYLSISNVVNNLTSIDTDKPVSALQAKILNDNTKLDSTPVAYEFANGAVSNGATIIDNGFTIPIGSTGNNSFFIINKNPSGYDSANYVGRKITVVAVVSITNFAQLSLDSNLIKMNRFVGEAGAGSSLLMDLVTFDNVDSGGNRTKTLTGTYTMTQSDIDNQYWYEFTYQVFNGVPTTAVVNVTSISNTVTVSNRINKSTVSNTNRLDIIQPQVVINTTDVNNIKTAIALPDSIQNSVYKNGEALNGAVFIANGINIPIGSTGRLSYFYYGASNSSFNPQITFVGSVMKVVFELITTNYLQLSSSNTITLQRKQGGKTITASVAFDTISFVDNTVGSTRTRTYTGTRVMTQSDIDNQYWYQPYSQVQNTAVVSTAVTITLGTSSNISFTKNVNSNVLALNERVSLLEGSSSSSSIIKIVKRNGTVGVDCDYTGRRAVQDAIDDITDASASKQYIIRASGVFEATQVSHFDKGSGQFEFILLKPYVHLIGTTKDDFVLSGKLPNNLGSGFAYSNYQTMRHDVNNSRIENVSIIGENLRYPLHIDGGAYGNKNFIQSIKGCKIWHKGNSGDALNWGSVTPLGLGTSDGQQLTLEDCEIKGTISCAYAHTNSNFVNPSIVKYIRCKFSFTTGNAIISAQPLGSGVRDKMIFESPNMGIGNIGYSSIPWIPTELINQRADHAEIDIDMFNSSPIPFGNSSLSGYGLKIESKTTGSASTVSFDQTSTAFNVIIGNSVESTDIINRYGRNQIYGYQYKSGGQALKGYAIGTLDIGQYVVGLAQIYYIGALGKRLGDCSVVNKTLTVIIDGTTYNIVFDKNYNGTANTVAPTYSNTQIINEIKAVIGSVANVTEYVSGMDYYPNFKDNQLMINNDTTEVLAGMGIVFTSGSTFRKALNSDSKIDGICLDDARIGDEARVIISGEIYSQSYGTRFQANEVTTITHAIGTQLGISVSTPGKFDSTASPKVVKVVRANVLKII